MNIAIPPTKLTRVIALGTLLLGCGDYGGGKSERFLSPANGSPTILPEASQDATAETTLTFPDVSSIFGTTCTGSNCHAAAVWESLEAIKAKGASKIAARITAVGMRQMPPSPGGDAFKRSDKGKMLLEWLRSGADLR